MSWAQKSMIYDYKYKKSKIFFMNYQINILSEKKIMP